MGTPSKQIGWSTESNLLHAILRQLDQLAGIISTSGGGGGGGGGNFVTTDTIQTIIARKDFSTVAGPAATFTSSTGNTVNVTATTGSGVYATSVDGPGIEGYSSNDPGIFGYSTNSAGVFAHSVNSVALVVDSLNPANLSDLANFSVASTPVVRITVTGQVITSANAIINTVIAGIGASPGAGNTVFGTNSQTISTGIDNSSFGFNTLSSVTTGTDNDAFGFNALKDNTIGSFNVAIGVNSLSSNISGGSNVAIGGSSLRANTLSGFNVAVGTNAMNVFVATGTSGACVAVGADSMSNNATGTGNTAVGAGSARYIVGSNNTSIGRFAGSGPSGSIASNTGVHNITLGYLAGSNISSGNNNVIIATATPVGGLTTGSNNLIIAQNIGNTTGITTGSGNTIIGKVAGLAAGLNNTVIVSDGVGTQRFISDSTNLSTLPQQTLALINADATGKAIITKEFTNQGITINSTNVPIGGSISITTPPNVVTTMTLGAPFLNSTITRNTVTGWTFAVTAGKNYRIEIIAAYQTAALTTGGSIGFILSSGTGTITGILEGEIVQTTAATGLRTSIRDINAVNTTAGSFMTTTGVGVINSPHYMGGRAYFSCITTGVFEVQFASEIAVSTAQLNAGSVLIVTEY